MPNAEIDAFLGAKAAPEPEPAVPTQEAAPAPAERPADKPAAHDDDADPPEAREGDPIVPRAAYEAERRKRQDYKAQAAKLEGELAELRRQNEEAKRAAQPPPQQYQPPPAPLDPVNDPQAFVQRLQTVILNERLNNSEMFLRDKIGPEKVDQYVSEFKKAAEADPALFQKMYAQPNPYGWMTREVDRLRTFARIGDDPVTYEQRLKEQWEAERAAQQPAQPEPPPVSPAAGQPRSLATTRSVAPRSAPQWTGPTPLNEIARRG